MQCKRLIVRETTALWVTLLINHVPRVFFPHVGVGREKVPVPLFQSHPYVREKSPGSKVAY